jgi:hemolysin activation/secretion protein
MHASSKKKQQLRSQCLILVACMRFISSAYGDDVTESPLREAQAPAQPHTQPKFEIWEFDVSGSTLIDRKLLERALTPFLGPNKTAEDVQKAADAIETLYRDSGYATVFVDIPEQNVTSGAVKLAITEGKISRVRISGADYFTPSSIREQLKSVGVNQSLYVPGIQQDINNINTYAQDLRVAPVLKPGLYPGDVELEIKVDDKKPLHGNVELNNYHTAQTSEARLAASVGYYNLWQRGHSISLQAQVSPQDSKEVRVLGVTYLLPAGEKGRIALYALKSESEIAAVSDVTVVGNGVISGLRYVVQLPSDAHLIHSLSVGVDNKNFKEDIRLVSADSLKTPIVYNVWSLLYSSNFLEKNSTTNFGAEFAFGVDGLGNDINEFEQKRALARPNFSHLELKFRRVDFFGDWQLHSKLRIHRASAPLISNEQYSAGGASSVRGYFDSEALGDNAMVWGVEGVTPMWLKQRAWLQDLRLSLFAEGAKLTILDPLYGQKANFQLMGTGIGLRAELCKGWQINVDGGYPLRAADNVDRGDIMVQADLSWNF